MDARELVEVEDKQMHLLEIVTDAVYAGNKNDRKSTTSFQVFLHGDLMESRVRSQKSISLSSGESEFVAMVGGCSDGLLVRHLWMEMTKEELEMKVKSDSSAARAMVQRQGIGRVRHLDAALLWIQRKEKEKTLAVSPIPTELNCADIGTKSLTRRRLFGLLYMLKMVNSSGDRIGTDEFQELEHREQMKKGLKKVMKGKKDLRIGLLMMMASMDVAAGSRTNGKEEEAENEWLWWAFGSLALIGALSLTQWLRCNMVINGWNFMMKIAKKTIMEIVNYKNEGRNGMKEKSIQATEWLEAEVIQSYKKQANELQAEVYRLEDYVIELGEQVKDLRQQRNDIFRQFQLTDQHGQRLMRERLMYRTTKGNRIKIHFNPSCPHFTQAEATSLCAKCVSGDGVIESVEM